MQALLARFNSKHGQLRLDCFKRLPYFFEGWLAGECACAAMSVFGVKCQIYINEKFEGIDKVDIGLSVDGSFCALELKHIPTLSNNAKSRFHGGKPSTAVKDFLKLYTINRRNHILCKLLFLYGPVDRADCHGDICEIKGQRLDRVCLRCSMNEFVRETRVQNINWRYHPLLTDRMYLVEVDI